MNRSSQAAVEVASPKTSGQRAKPRRPVPPGAPYSMAVTTKPWPMQVSTLPRPWIKLDLFGQESVNHRGDSNKQPDKSGAAFSCTASGLV